MRTWGIPHHVVSITAAAALLVSCDGSSEWATTSAPQIPAHQASTSSGELIYVTTGKGVVVLSYPTGQIVQVLPWYVASSYICSDPGNGNIFIPEGSNIYEYSHGGSSPIAILAIPSGYSEPAGCAVDAKSGNLAVAIIAGRSNRGALLVYPGGHGIATAYADNRLQFFDYPAYDGSGDLFVTTDTVGGAFRIAEIPDGRSRFRLVRLLNYDTGPRKIQWDGEYLTLLGGGTGGSAVEQIVITGKTGRVVGSVALIGGDPAGYFWIQNSTVFSLFKKRRKHNNQAVATWDYPSGGEPTAVFYGLTKGKRDNASDLTVSVPPSR
jgi:hypothetical protein